MKPSFDLLLLRFAESTFFISIVLLVRNPDVTQLLILTLILVLCLLRSRTMGHPLMTVKQYYTIKNCLKLIYLFLIAFLNQRHTFLLTFEQNPQCITLLKACVFSDASFALMLWDQQADTGDRLIAPLQNLDKSFLFLLLPQNLDFRLASLLEYPYFLECFPTCVSQKYVLCLYLLLVG